MHGKAGLPPRRETGAALLLPSSNRLQMCSFAQFFFVQFFLFEDALICGFVFWAISRQLREGIALARWEISHEASNQTCAFGPGLLRPYLCTCSGGKP